MTLLCDRCANATGIFAPTWDIYSQNYTGTQYQLGKFFEHTITGLRTGQNVSLIDAPDYEKYENLMISGYLTGYYEIDNRNRINKAYYVGDKIGVSYDEPNQVVRYPEEFFKIVKYLEPSGAHGFSFTPWYELTQRNCNHCGITLW